MEWYNYVACFFAGAFMSNAVPHFVHGISGDKFPSPFSKPRGVGLSSPTTNVVWGLFNALVGYLLFRAGHVCAGQTLPLIVFFIGFSAMSIVMSISFQRKHKE
jgi:hypothetical protein